MTSRAWEDGQTLNALGSEVELYEPVIPEAPRGVTDPAYLEQFGRVSEIEARTANGETITYRFQQD